MKQFECRVYLDCATDAEKCISGWISFLCDAECPQHAIDLAARKYLAGSTPENAIAPNDIAMIDVYDDERRCVAGRTVRAREL